MVTVKERVTKHDWTAELPIHSTEWQCYSFHFHMGMEPKKNKSTHNLCENLRKTENNKILEFLNQKKKERMILYKIRWSFILVLFSCCCWCKKENLFFLVFLSNPIGPSNVINSLDYSFDCLFFSSINIIIINRKKMLHTTVVRNLVSKEPLQQDTHNLDDRLL